MKACIVLIVLAVAVQAQKFEPAKCDYSKEMMCSGTWNEDWTEQITADFCIPMQNGDCWNYCPTQCCKDSVMCPGKMDPKGCKEPDFCHHGKFCPVNCDWEKEMMCPGPWDPKTGEQTGPDSCMPYKNGECAAHCPKQCGEKEMLCPGKMDPKGCQEPDFCHHGKFCPVNCDWEKEMMCPGPWDPKNGEQTGPDMCMPHKNGECAAHCPQQCGEKDMMCPGKTHADGCKDADYCVAGKFCPADCDYSEEMMCPGTWNEDWTEQLTADYCMPYKNGDCPAYCPKQCGEKEMLCPGKEHTDGCKDADYCVAGKFCPVECDWEKEMMCPGTWNEDWTEQITADYCMPYKNGDCSAYCPKQCGKEEILCPRMDPKGCPIPDTCYPAKDGCPKM